MTIVFDLDDTLYPEMDFVRSAYRAIAHRYGRHLLTAMMAAETPREAFDSIGLPICDILSLYRSHIPDIRLPWQSLYTLSSLRRVGFSLGLVTDGRSITQRHKIQSLGLDRFIDPAMIFISEEIGSDKISGDAFRMIMSRTDDVGPYLYIGDNPAKDFVAPNRLGWSTVLYKRGGAGENIFDVGNTDVAVENRASEEIEMLTDLLKLVDVL